MLDDFHTARCGVSCAVQLERGKRQKRPEKLRGSNRSKKELEHGFETCRWRLEHEINWEDLNIGLSSLSHHGIKKKGVAWSFSPVYCWMSGCRSWNERRLTKSISAERLLCDSWKNSTEHLCSSSALTQLPTKKDRWKKAAIPKL